MEVILIFFFLNGGLEDRQCIHSFLLSLELKNELMKIRSTLNTRWCCLKNSKTVKIADDHSYNHLVHLECMKLVMGFLLCKKKDIPCV
jgi:hypothetical protein